MCAGNKGILKSRDPLSNANLIAAIDEEVECGGNVAYPVGWAAMAVKLDMEARGELLCDRSAKKPVISLA